MSWWETLKQANTLDIVKELGRQLTKDLPIVAKAIDGIENLENKQTQARVDEFLGKIATEGKEILECVRHIQGETVAQRLEILAQFPGMEQKFATLGQGLSEEFAGLKDSLEQGIDNLKEMLTQLWEDLRSLQQRDSLEQGVDNLKEILTQLRKDVRSLQQRDNPAACLEEAGGASLVSFGDSRR